MKRQLALLALAATLSASCQGNGNYPNYPNADRYSIGAGSTAATINEVDIDWVAGDVEVVYTDGTDIRWQEQFIKGPQDSHTQMRYYVEGTTLHIQFCEPGRWKGSKNLQKQLVVEVPQGYVLPKLEVDQVSGNVRSSVLAMELDVETVSGEAILYNAQERADINVDAVSGNVKIDGTAASAEIDVETVSGSVKITCAAAAREIDLETVSGNMALNLPSAAGFRSEYSTISGKFSCGFNGQLQSNVFTYGSTPQTRIQASSVSGDLEIMPNE